MIEKLDKSDFELSVGKTVEAECYLNSQQSEKNPDYWFIGLTLAWVSDADGKCDSEEPEQNTGSGNSDDEPEEDLTELGGPEYETMSALGSLCGVKDIRTVVKANALATDLGLDSISLGNCIAFVMECTQNGIFFDPAQQEMKIQFG